GGALGEEDLNDPIRTSPALTYEHTKQVEEVRKNLHRTQGLMDLGRYDEAEAEAQKVLEIDRYNKAARRMLEKVAVAKSDYYKAAYDETRSKLLSEVDAAWETTIPPAPEAKQAEGKPSILPTPAPPAANSKLGRMRQSLQKKSDELAVARRKLMDIAEKTGVIFVEDEKGGRATGNRVELAELAAKKLYETERETEEIRFQIKKLSELKNTEELIAKASALPNVGFKRSYDQYQTAKRDLAVKLASGLSTSHPEVVAQKKRVNELEESLERRTESAKASLRHRLKTLDGRVAKMKEVIAEQGTSKTREMSDFNNARKKYQQLLAQKEQLAARYDHEKIQAHKRGEKVPTIKLPTPRATPAQALPEETSTRTQPFSTFSLNVSDVSFKLAKVSLLEKGKWPEASKVRTEEFVNAFDYGDPTPRRGDPVACAVEQSAHPFLQQRNLLRIGMKTAAMGRSQPLRLTVLLDNSGSMERDDREASVVAAMKVLASQLGPQDVVTLVSFARTPRLLADRLSGDKAMQLVKLVERTPSEGGTNLEEALRLSHKLAKRQHQAGAQSRIVLITDGVANLGNTVPEELSKQIETMRQQGISFDACGVGAEGLNDDILEALTRKGDGRYYFLNRPEDADTGFAKQLAGALSPAAKNVKIQVVFNPKRVSRYRLLGFEKHRLNKEDFRNDKVDAAEMAAEEAGNAVYQIQVNPAGEGELGDVFVRFLDVSTGKMVERSWPLPYEPQAKPFENAAPSMQLAGTAAMLGEKLHGTDAGSVRIPMISNTLNKLRAHYHSSPQVQNLIRMCEIVNR
ncbi:MAG: YfbK domain-containing protein, partial [Akkermansiaceae bacterium]